MPMVTRERAAPQGGEGQNVDTEETAHTLNPSEALGRAIALRRVELGLSRRELASGAGLSYPYVSEIERGGRSPSARAQRALAAALGLSPADLLARADTAATPGGDAPFSGTTPPGLASLVRRLVREELALAGPSHRAPAAPADLLEDPAQLRHEVLVTARAMLENDDLAFDDEGDIPIRRGEAMLFVRVLDEPLSVLVFSPVLAEIEVGAALLDRLNDLNSGTHFVRHCYTHGGVVIDLEVAGENFRPEQLASACRAVSDAADTVGPVLRDEFGGRLFFGDETPAKPRRGSLGYL